MFVPSVLALVKKTIWKMTKQYLEDYAVGQVYRSRRLRVDRDQIIAFAAQFDPQPYHLDEEAARKSIFGGLAASGWHGIPQH